MDSNQSNQQLRDMGSITKHGGSHHPVLHRVQLYERIPCAHYESGIGLWGAFYAAFSRLSGDRGYYEVEIDPRNYGEIEEIRER